MTYRALMLVALAAAGMVGCGSQASEDDDATAAGAALASMPDGHFVIASTPESGSYVSKLSLWPGDMFKLEYVRRSSSWVPFAPSQEERLVSFGTLARNPSEDGRTIVTFLDPNAEEQPEFYVVTTPGGMKLSSRAGDSFELKAAPAPPTDTRVIRCDGDELAAVVTLDENERLRGTFAVTPKGEPGQWMPKEGSLSVAYQSRARSGDEFYYDGVDNGSNRYDFGLKQSDVAKTSGAIGDLEVHFLPRGQAVGAAATYFLKCEIGTK